MCRSPSRLCREPSAGPGLPAFPLLFLVLVLLLVLGTLLLPTAGRAATCAATGTQELTPAAVHAARMEAKTAAGAYDFSTGAMDAAKQCADLINRLSRIRIGSFLIPGIADLVAAAKEAVEDGLEDTVDEACRYVAQNGTNWVRSQISTARQTANATASELVQANVSVTNPNTSAVLATYRSRLKSRLPTYSDLPSLGDLR